MATVADSEEKSELSPGDHRHKSWIEYGVQEAQLMQKNLEKTVNSAIETASTRLSEIRSTSYAHTLMTIDMLQDMMSDYHAYEDIFFGKIKEGLTVAASNPMVTCGVAAGLGILTLKRPRRFLYYGIQRLLLSEEALVSRADAKVKELRQSIELLKAESEKLEKKALQAEEEMKRGRTKLRQAGNQIQGVIRSAYKIERQARGMKDVVGELSSGQASLFRSQVSKLASEAKRERNVLTKEVSKISNYGISV
ncbi:RGS1-HXK1-interacting protein 1-like [Macadamia integrifolia]|uniref:RGS1-HXK1-interacting protein 1-like n=1 Tax=Macadamia integrifolia TaxID=60698 RepID=UPI001C4ECA39|nr:RGS1-HXK1-interacting protein 1-like [Macadamia integrifolia]